MSVRAGRLILDTSCYKSLEDQGAFERFVANTRAAAWVPVPTPINILEIAGHGNAKVRNRLLSTFRRVYREAPALPWIQDWLRDSGRSLLKNEDRFLLRGSGVDYLVEGGTALESKREPALSFLSGIDARFDAIYDGTREAIQRLTREHPVRDPWTSARDFLDRIWMSPELAGHHMVGFWRELGLPGDPPADELFRSEAWRLFYEGYGIAAWERGVLKEQPRRAHQTDLLQLVYLAYSQRRMLASADQSFLRAAEAMIDASYPNMWVVHIDELCG
jgi:hypothetical protein